MTKHYIYSITSLNNGKKYVGQTKNLASRMSNHMMANTEVGELFQEDFLNMKIEVLEILEGVNEREVATAEQRWIDEFDCVENGYNKIPARSGDKELFIPDEFLNKKLFKEDQDRLAERMKIRRNNRQLKSRGIVDLLKEQGWTVYRGQARTGRYIQITPPQN